MAVPLRVRQAHHRNQAAEVETVGGGIKAHVDGAPRFVQVSVQIFGGHRVEEAAPPQFFQKWTLVVGLGGHAVRELPSSHRG
jgi:hypothetical protein